MSPHEHPKADDGARDGLRAPGGGGLKAATLAVQMIADV